MSNTENSPSPQLPFDVVIVEFVPNEDRVRPAAAAISLVMLGTTAESVVIASA
jgi:hypothetical protein